MKLSCEIFICVSLLTFGALADQGFYREVYYNISGTAINDLTGNPNFPDAPDEELIVNSIFETPTNLADNYGQRLRAYITPQVSGNYTFYIATDDNGQLWLSSNDNPANKTLIAWVNNHTAVREWTKEANQKSALKNLTAGTRYYIEVLQKEGGGGDNCAIGWTPPGVGTTISVVPAEVLTVYFEPPFIKAPPVSVQVFEQNVGVEMATFKVVATRRSGITYQWQSNGVNIPGAESPTYSLVADTANSNKLFRCVLTSRGGTLTSAAVGYSIVPDTFSPALLGAQGYHNPRQLTLRFSEPLEPTTAGNAASFMVSGTTVLDARLIEGLNAVVLSLADPLVAGVPVALSCTLFDRAVPSNTLVVSGYSHTPALLTPAPVALVRGMQEMAGPSSRRTQVAITEIHHTPAIRGDGRDIRFVELYNSDPFFVDVGGYVFSGAFDFVIPTGTQIPAKGYLVLAPAPADITAVYSIANVIGGFSATAFGGSSAITVHDPIGGWLTTVAYSDTFPWPVAAAGAGHSLVLVRPSLGEVYPEAWAASARLGGSPGTTEPLITHGYESIVLNEVLAHPGAGDGFVELYNFSGVAVNIAGCALKVDDPASTGFVFPPGSSVPAGGHLALTESDLGFLINGRGDALWLTAPPAAGSVVIDALRFDDQEAGVALGRSPDGASLWNRVQGPTPGSANTGRQAAQVVLNEIMYHPLRDTSRDEYIELYNTGTNALSLSGWKLGGDITYTFTTESLAAGGYLLVPRDRAVFQQLYPAVTALAVGSYSGTLPNKRGSVTLERPAFVMDTNEAGGPVAKEKGVLIESVTYRDGGNWHKNADGLGSSLERVDPRGDPALAASWQASDETQSSEWMTLEFSGLIDLGMSGKGDPNEVHIGLMDAGECLIDQVEVYEEGGANLVNNSSFEANTADWRFMGSHEDSFIVEDAGAPQGARVLYLKASDQVHTGGNVVRGTMSRSMAKSGRGTIRARARWLSGSPELLVRTRGNWLEATGSIVTTLALGTPGAANSRAANAAPSITEVIHQPLLPRNGEAITVYARVQDADDLWDVTLHYHVDNVVSESSVKMTLCSAGWLKGVIPAGQPNNALIAFYVAAEDLSSPVKRSTYPATAPVRECLVRFNEPLEGRNFGIYRFWLTAQNYNYWRSRERGSNHPVDITFIYNNRPIYEAGIMYGGSPFHSGYGAPIDNGSIDYKILFKDDDEVLDSGRMILATLGNLGSDDVGIKEQFNYELVKALGQPNPRRRFIHLYANGNEQTPRKIFEDSEKPNKDYLARWFEDDPERDFFKIDDWFEYVPDLSSFDSVNATLQPFRTPAPDGDGSVFKLGRYRWNWQKRSANNFQYNNFTNFFSLVEALNTVDPVSRAALVEAMVDLDSFAGIIAMNHFITNWDTYGYERGKNMYLYQALSGWSLVAWDLDFNFESGRLSTTMDPNNGGFPVNDPTIRNFLKIPVVTRAYWRAVQRVMAASQDSAVRTTLRARYNALQADNTNLGGNFDAHFNLVNSRHTNVANELNSLDPVNFVVTSPATTVSTSSANVTIVSGTAPFAAVSILVNGVATPVSWSTATAWTANIVLNGGTNAFSFSALDRNGIPVRGGAVARQIIYTGAPLDSMEGFLVISEIMTLGVTEDAEYVELHNRSQSTVMNLAGITVDGSVRFTFPAGLFLNPGQCCLLVEDMDVFASVYTEAAGRVYGKYSGRLNPAGGTVVLKRPAAGFEFNDVVLDRVDYSGTFPWPEIPAPGVALQLNNPAIDSGRPANWFAATVAAQAVTNTVVNWSTRWSYLTTSYPGAGWNAASFNSSGWLSGPGPLGWDSKDLPVPLATRLTPSGRLAHYFRTTFNFDGNPSTAKLLLTYMLDDGAVFYLNGSEIHRSALMPLGSITDTTATTGFIAAAAIQGAFEIASHQLQEGANVLAVSVHQVNTGSSDLVFGMKLEVASDCVRANSPGTVNVAETPLAGLPEIWLNEIQTQNITGPVDDSGQHEPWVELFNSSASASSLAGWKLTTTQGDPGWCFPGGVEIPAGGYLRVWLDGELPAVQDPAHLHTSFRFGFASGMLILVNPDELVVDFMQFEHLGADTAYGCWPNGNFRTRRNLNPPTPGAANRVEKRSQSVVINEFMATNKLFINPLTGAADDWFELLNDGTEAMELGGYLVTDTLASNEPPLPSLSKTFAIPDGIRLNPGEALRIWTGASKSGSLPFDPANLQAPFGLGKSGDAIYLFNAAATLVDSVTFAKEENDLQSLGRWVNGARGEWVFFDEPTPGLPNRNPIFGAGHIQQPPALRVDECQYLCFTNTLNHTKPAGFEFRLFDVDGSALPAGLLFNQTSGVLQWTPQEDQGPGFYEFDLVGYIVDGVTITACDHLLWSIRVEERPSRPWFTPVPKIAVNEGALIQFTCQVFRGQEIPYYETFTNLRLEGAVPANALFNPLTGKFSWQTGEIDGPATHTIKVVAEDSVVPEIRCEMVVTMVVAEVNSPFTLASPTKYYLWNNEPLAVGMQVSDPDLPPNIFSYALLTGPAGCSVNSSTGLLQWQPAAGFVGNESVRVRVFDNAGAAQNFTLTLYVSASVLSTQEATVQSDGSLKIKWESKRDTSYYIEWSPSLSAPHWQSIGMDQPVAGTGGVVSYMVMPSLIGAPEKAFFRVQQYR